MVKLNVMYGHPTDPDAFEKHYAEVHVPLAQKIPGVANFEAAKVVGAPDGSKADFYRTAELWFEDEAAMGAAMGSPEGKATQEDIGNFASGGATVFVSAVEG